MNVSPGEGYRVPEKSELSIGMKVEIYEHPMMYNLRGSIFIQWHFVTIWEHTYSEPGFIPFNSLRKRIAAGKIRVPK